MIITIIYCDIIIRWMSSTSSTWNTFLECCVTPTVPLVQLAAIDIYCHSVLFCSQPLVHHPLFLVSSDTIALWAALIMMHLYMVLWSPWMFVLHLLRKNVYVKNKYQKRSIWPSLLIYLIFFLMAYVNLALVPCWLWRKLTSSPFIPKPIFALAMLMTWRKPFRIYVGKLSMSVFGEETTKCGFKLPHTTLLASHMVNFARWTMTWHGRKSLTPTSFHLLHGHCTFGPTTLKVHGKLAPLWWSQLLCFLSSSPLWEHVLCGFWPSVYILTTCLDWSALTLPTYAIQMSKKRLPWTPSPPGWVCVCTFSKEVKLVPVVDAERSIDHLLILLSLRSSFTWITYYSFVLLWIKRNTDYLLILLSLRSPFTCITVYSILQQVTYWYCCPWGVLLHAFHFIPFYSIVVLWSNIFRNEQMAWTPSPPGWVCVCTFSKEVKLVPVVDAERHIDYLLTTYWYFCPWGVLLHVSQSIPFCSSRGTRHVIDDLS